MLQCRDITCKTLLENSLNTMKDDKICIVEDCNLPLINLSHLSSYDQLERESCIHEITQAASTWGFFQVVNHGISKKVLESLEYEQKKVFCQPFERKIQNNFLNLSSNSYLWGNSKATCLKQLSWSEAFHMSITDISSMRTTERNNLRLTMERFAKEASDLSKTLVEILAENLGIKFSYFQENCPLGSIYLRTNRYPPCPYSSSKLVLGRIPRMDSDFLSVVHEDQIGGLQLVKDGRWSGVKPKPEALIINIGDLFEALSKGVYKSIKHRVVASQFEKFSAAYFYCASDEATVKSYSQPVILGSSASKNTNGKTRKMFKTLLRKLGSKGFFYEK